MKQTEIGLIPDDWEVKRLGDVAFLKSGKTIDFSATKEGIYPCYGGNGIRAYIPFYSHDGAFPIIGRQGELCGNVQYADGKFYATEHAVVCTPNNNVDSKWLYFQLIKADINKYKTGNAQPGISVDKINSEVFIPFPPIAEQQRIAKALSDVDALISTTEKLIQKKKNIKQGAMQNLLTGKKHLPGFSHQTKSPTYKQTELGPIPEDWEVKTLNELINDISDGPFGSNLKTEHYTTEREVRIIQLSNVGEDGWDNENVKYTTFTHAKEIQRCIVPYGSIVIAKMMPAGRSILCPNQEKMYILGSDCVRITPNSLLDSLFFMYFSKTSFYLNQIKENTQGSTRARTSVSKLKRIEIALPSKEEQTAIANVLSSMDKEIETLNTKLEKYRNLKTAMMQQLLTGKIRLK